MLRLRIHLLRKTVARWECRICGEICAPERIDNKVKEELMDASEWDVMGETILPQMNFVNGMRSGKVFYLSDHPGMTSPDMLPKPPWEMTATEIAEAVRKAEMRMRIRANPVTEPVRVRKIDYLKCLLAGEESTGDILKEMGEKEDTMRTLSAEKIKRVTIECEGGKTYTGTITRIEGCPWDYGTMTVEAKIGAPVGEYGIQRVIFNNPATIVYWTDGTKTVVKCQKGDEYRRETGLAMAIAKKHLGNKGNYNEVFKNFIGEE